jgi:hypothetical protein
MFFIQKIPYPPRHNVTISNTLPSTKSWELHCWNLIKVLSPFHITWVLWLDWEMHVTWYQNHEVLSLNLGYTLILLRVIFIYRSPYGEARVAQTSGLQSGVAGLWLARSRGILEFDKKVLSPLFISPRFYGWTDRGKWYKFHCSISSRRVVSFSVLGATPLMGTLPFLLISPLPTTRFTYVQFYYINRAITSNE